MVPNPRSAEDFRAIIESHEDISTETSLKGTPKGVTVGDLLELFASDAHCFMKVTTSNRRAPTPVGATIAVETFDQLQQVYDQLGLNGVADTGANDNGTFTVAYQFD